MMNFKKVLLMSAFAVVAAVNIGCVGTTDEYISREDLDWYNYSDYDYDRAPETKYTTTQASTQAPTQATTQKPTQAVVETAPVDTRVPNYKSTSTETTTVKYTWKNYQGTATRSMSMDYFTEMYNYYSSLDRYYEPSEYKYYINDEINAKICKIIAESIYDFAISKGETEFDAIMELASFVQSLEYMSDVNSKGQSIEYPKYPIETLMEGGGDCEDTTILLITMLNELGYGTAVIEYDAHVMVGIKGGDNVTGSYYKKDGVCYFVLETTGEGWKLGELPDSRKGQSAYVHVTR